MFCLGTTVTVDGITYTLKNMMATVSGGSPTASEITIPAFVSSGGSTYLVTGIGNYFMSGSKTLTKLVINAVDVTVDNYSFSNCSILTSVIVNGNLTAKGGAFVDCPSLSSVIVNGSLSISGTCFSDDCPNLKYVSTTSGTASACLQVSKQPLQRLQRR